MATDVADVRLADARRVAEREGTALDAPGARRRAARRRSRRDRARIGESADDVARIDARELSAEAFERHVEATFADSGIEHHVEVPEVLRGSSVSDRGELHRDEVFVRGDRDRDAFVRLRGPKQRISIAEDAHRNSIDDRVDGAVRDGRDRDPWTSEGEILGQLRGVEGSGDEDVEVRRFAMGESKSDRDATCEVHTVRKQRGEPDEGDELLLVDPRISRPRQVDLHGRSHSPPARERRGRASSTRTRARAEEGRALRRYGRSVGAVPNRTKRAANASHRGCHAS